MSPVERLVSGAPAKPPLSTDASIVLVLAGTAMPFARSAEGEAQRWLRVLRLHGEVGRALQGLGVGETPLRQGLGSRPGSWSGRTPLGGRAVPAVVARARTCAIGRGAAAIGTRELLVAVMQAYGDLFTAELRASGTSSGELLERVAAKRSDG